MENPINIYGLWTWNFWDFFDVSVRFELTSIYKYFKYSNDTQVILDFPSRDFHDLSRIITISSDLARLFRIFMKFQTLEIIILRGNTDFQDFIVTWQKMNLISDSLFFSQIILGCNFRIWRFFQLLHSHKNYDFWNFTQAYIFSQKIIVAHFL